MMLTVINYKWWSLISEQSEQNGIYLIWLLLLLCYIDVFGYYAYLVTR